MSNIANAIYQAIVTHTAWKKRLNELVKTGTSEQDFKIESCEFKQWLEENVQELNHYEHYAKVTELHKTMHEKADKIVLLVWVQILSSTILINQQLMKGVISITRDPPQTR